MTDTFEARILIKGKREGGRWSASTPYAPHLVAEGHATLNAALVELFANLRPFMTGAEYRGQA